MAEVIKVPKTPKSAYKPGRPPSALVRAQIRMLEEATAAYGPPKPAALKASALKTRVRKAGARKMAARKVGIPKAGFEQRMPKTEGQAARYIQDLHARISGLVAASAVGAVPAQVSAAPQAAAASKTARSATGRKKTTMRPKRKTARKIPRNTVRRKAR